METVGDGRGVGRGCQNHMTVEGGWFWAKMKWRDWQNVDRSIYRKEENKSSWFVLRNWVSAVESDGFLGSQKMKKKSLTRNQGRKSVRVCVCVWGGKVAWRESKQSTSPVWLKWASVACSQTGWQRDATSRRCHRPISICCSGLPLPNNNPHLTAFPLFEYGAREPHWLSPLLFVPTSFFNTRRAWTVALFPINVQHKTALWKKKSFILNDASAIFRVYYEECSDLLLCIFSCGVPITALTGPGTLRLAACAVAANGSLVVAEINASSARRPLALMSTCPLSVEIKPGIINAYLQPCLPVFSPGVLHTSPQTHLCVHHSLFSRCLPFWGELSHQNNKKTAYRLFVHRCGSPAQLYSGTAWFSRWVGRFPVDSGAARVTLYLENTDLRVVRDSTHVFF